MYHIHLLIVSNDDLKDFVTLAKGLSQNPKRENNDM